MWLHEGICETFKIYFLFLVDVFYLYTNTLKAIQKIVKKSLMIN